MILLIVQKSCTPGMVLKPKNNGINYQPQLVNARISEPSTVPNPQRTATSRGTLLGTFQLFNFQKVTKPRKNHSFSKFTPEDHWFGVDEMSVSNGPPKRGLRLSCPQKIRPFETNPTRNIQQNKSPHLTTSTPEEPQSGFAEVSIFIPISR